MKEIIAIIPARSGSKGIKNKNLQILGGKSLVAWPIELAKSVKKITRIIVSTDDKKITKAAKEYGAEVPFLRPKSLAKDETPTLPVLQHCLKYLREKEGYKPEIVCCLYPTAPFLKRKTIVKALSLFEKSNCNSVMSVVEDDGKFWVYERNKYRPLYPKERVNRQYYQPLYREAGNIYFSKYKVLMKMNKLIDEKKLEFIFVSSEETVDIDSLADLQTARDLLKK